MSRPEAGRSGRAATADSRVARRRRRRRSAAGNRTLDVRRHYRARRRTSAAAPQLRGPVGRILVAERPESGPRSWEERLSRPLPPLLDAAVRALAGAGPFAPRTRRGQGARRSSSASRGVRATPRKERPPRPLPPLLDAAGRAPTSPARPRAHNHPHTHETPGRCRALAFRGGDVCRCGTALNMWPTRRGGSTAGETLYDDGFTRSRSR